MKRPMRVLSLIGDLHFGGAEARLLSIARTIDRSSFEHFVFTLNRPNPALDERWGTMREQFNAAGVVTHDLGKLGKAARAARGASRLAGIKDVSSTVIRLLREIRRRRIDLIDAHLEDAGCVAELAGRISRRPVVLTVYHTGVLQGAFRIPGIVLLRSVDAIVTDSAVRCADFRRFSRMGAARYSVIPNGISPPIAQAPAERVRGAAKIEAEGDIVVGQVSRLLPFKGHMELLEAARTVIGRVPNVRFLFAGYVRTDDTYLRSLLERAKELGVADRVHIVSYPGPIGDIWQLIDIHVHASLFDSLPNAIIEGMSLGKPAVVTDVGGAASVVENGVSGFVVPPRDPQRLAGAILELVNRPDLRRSFGEAARRIHRSTLTAEIMTRQLERLFSKLILANRTRYPAPLTQGTAG